MTALAELEEFKKFLAEAIEALGLDSEVFVGKQTLNPKP